ncbi:MAG: universal stress protein [Gammaproteobacteria bacterium]|nr:universal stress protein [Gammaproteobacteria bacterium]
MIQLRKIFCVIDPTTSNQRALARATYIGGATGAAVHAYVSTFAGADRPAEDRDELREVEVARYRAWLESLIAPLRERGIDVTTEVDWQDDWRAALGPAASRAGADLIIKSSYRRAAPQRRLLKTADWTLLRTADCPVMLAKAEKVVRDGIVMAAVNLNARDPDHEALNDAVLAYANGIASAAGADLHVVNAFAGSENFIHTPDLARRAGVPRANAHTGDAAPDELITQVARDVGAQLVVIGSVARRGLAAAVVGNTAERILDRLDCDVVTIFRTQGEAQG